jgi:hypothetical protein
MLLFTDGIKQRSAAVLTGVQGLRLRAVPIVGGAAGDDG